MTHVISLVASTHIICVNHDNTYWVMSSSERALRMVVFPALSKPRTSTRASLSLFLSFRRSDKSPMIITNGGREQLQKSNRDVKFQHTHTHTHVHTEQVAFYSTLKHIQFDYIYLSIRHIRWDGCPCRCRISTVETETKQTNRSHVFCGDQ